MNDVINTELFQEAYLGKSPTLVEAEKVMQDIIDMVKKNPLTIVNHTSENKKLQSLFKQQFGFKSVEIVWVDAVPRIPIAQTFTAVDSMISGKISFEFMDNGKGYYDKKHWTYAVIEISTGLITHTDLSAQELMAVILHEIGHNFDNSVYALIPQLFAILRPVGEIVLNDDGTKTVVINVPMWIKSMIINTLTLSELNKRVHVFANKLGDYVRKSFPKFHEFGHKVGLWFNDIYKYIARFSALAGLLQLPQILYNAPKTHLAYVATRKMEQFADSFASIYGYSVELATSLSKLEAGVLMDKHEYKKSKVSDLEKCLIDLSFVSSTIMDVFASGASHGSYGTRVSSSIRVLKREASSLEISNEIKRDILAQIDELEKAYNVYLEGEYGEHNFQYTSMVRELIDSLFGRETDLIARLFPSYYAGRKGYTYKRESEEYSETKEMAINMVLSSYHESVISKTECVELLDILTE